jgi:hypothetical protein
MYINPDPMQSIRFPVNSLENFTVNTSKTLYVVTNGLNVNQVMDRVSAKLDNISYRLFESESEAQYEYDKSKTVVSAGIIFGFHNKTSLESYAIRLPADRIALTVENFGSNKQGGK